MHGRTALGSEDVAGGRAPFASCPPFPRAKSSSQVEAAACAVRPRDGSPRPRARRGRRSHCALLRRRSRWLASSVDFCGLDKSARAAPTPILASNFENIFAEQKSVPSCLLRVGSSEGAAHVAHDGLRLCEARLGRAERQGSRELELPGNQFLDSSHGSTVFCSFSSTFQTFLGSYLLKFSPKSFSRCLSKES